jgi:hypothetical protein
MKNEFGARAHLALYSKILKLIFEVLKLII